LICQSIASVAAAQAPASKADAIIAASKRATGGTAWDEAGGCVEEGTRGSGAITYRTRFSLHGYGMRVDSDRAGSKRMMGFNGKARWMAGADGAVDVRSDPESLREGLVTDYLSISGFYFPERFPATFKYLRSAREAGRRFDVIEITPRGGRALEIWFDARTHLIKRVMDRHGFPAVTAEASNYRRAGPFTIAFRIDVFGPDGAAIDRGVVSSFGCGPIDATIFDPPIAR
jgi:hypothetical protein